MNDEELQSIKHSSEHLEKKLKDHFGNDKWNYIITCYEGSRELAQRFRSEKNKNKKGSISDEAEKKHEQDLKFYNGATP